MANRAERIVRTITLVVHKHSKSLACLFQVLLVSAVFVPTVPLLAEFALLVALLLISAQILSNFCGKSIMDFTKGIQI